MRLVYLEYWTLQFLPLMVYPKVLFQPNFSIRSLHGRRHMQLRAGVLRTKVPSSKSPLITHRHPAKRGALSHNDEITPCTCC